MSVKSRLQQRKTWFTLAQVAQRLSDEFSENIAIEEVMDLALEGDLNVWIQVHTPQRSMPLSPDANSDHFFTLAPPGIYRVDLMGDPLIRRYLRHKMEADGLGGNAPRLPLWSILKFDGEVETGSYAPLQKPGKTILDPMPFPPIESLKIRRECLDAFIADVGNQNSESVNEKDELRTLEAFGLLVELYASQHGPDYRNGAKPNASRIVEDMLDATPDDVTNMGERKLKDHVGDAIKAWEVKKRR